MSDIDTREGHSYPCQITNTYYPAEDVATAVFISQHTEEESWGLYLVGGDALAVLVNIDIDHANGED